MRLALLASMLLFPAFAAMPTAAQVVPDLQLDNPRVQSIRWEQGQEVLLTVMPSSGLTVMLEDGEHIELVSLGDENSFEVQVSPERNSFLVLPRRSEGAARMAVATDRRSYRFVVRTGIGLTAAYLVQFTYGEGQADAPESVAPAPGETLWSYRLRGDREVRPLTLLDDGTRTFIRYADGQALPAVFAIGPTGDEEIVNGYMRDDTYVIDRVYSELVFRIDDERARARRNSEPDVVQ